MKRLPGELYYDYCARRLMAKEETEDALKPRMIWNSSVVIPEDGKLKKVQVNGTWDRGKNKKKRDKKNAAKQHRIRSRRRNS